MQYYNIIIIPLRNFSATSTAIEIRRRSDPALEVRAETSQNCVYFKINSAVLGRMSNTFLNPNTIRAK